MTFLMNLAELRRQMRRFEPESDYYALTLLGERGGFSWSAFTHFAGWVDEDDPSKGELREASHVKASRMAGTWDMLGESYFVVNSQEHLWVFIHLGGHALVKSEIAHAHLAEVIAAEPAVRSGPLGFRSIRGLKKWEQNRAATPKQRMRILQRDQYKCRVCGRAPADYSDVELHVHHIRPWGKGGITEDRNLITLCHTCHRGLDPHEEFRLFELIRPKLFPPDRSTARAAYEEGVRQYREEFRLWQEQELKRTHRRHKT